MSSLPEFEVDDNEGYEREKRSIATGLWIHYNWRTIQAEEQIAVPAISILCDFPYIRKEVKEGLLQTSVDEKFHTYCHTLAVNEAKERYNKEIDSIPSVTVREMKEKLSGETEEWKRNIVTVAYAAVAEVSINAFLEVLSRSLEIRVCNRTLVDKHNKDEAVHSLIFIEAVRDLIRYGSDDERVFLKESIMAAKDSFLKHDFGMYESVFSKHDLSVSFSKSSDSMSRNMKGVNRLLKTLDDEVTA
nr:MULTISPECIES: diiron oxygenase [unclassified Halomonas]